MAIDIFNHITVPAAEKDFLLVPSSTVNGYTYQAIHNMPNTSAAFDALDYYAYYRFIDALSDYAFNGSTAGKDMALGNGSPSQVTMPTGMVNLEEYETPQPLFAQNNYEFQCSNEELNPRIDFCTEVLSTPALVLPSKIILSPNPVKDILDIQAQDYQNIEVVIYNSLGQDLVRFTASDNSISIDLSYLSGGVYYTYVNGKKEKIIKL
jgi:hypothetical protein